jgi:hypothetical protein
LSARTRRSPTGLGRVAPKPAWLVERGGLNRRPMGLGYLEGVTHDYFRHGTTTLFAALNGWTDR